MKCYENHAVADWAVRMAQKKMAEGRDRVGLPHASEVGGCLRRAYLNRTNPRMYDRKVVLKFATGFALQEWFLGPEKDGEPVWGVIFSPDRVVKNQPLDFKSTRRGYEVYAKDEFGKLDKTQPKVRFDPQTNDSWIRRMKMYCAAFSARKAHILVFFLYSDDLSAWTLEMEDADLAEGKELATSRAAILSDHLTRGEAPGVDLRMGLWECQHCPYLMINCLAELHAAGEHPDDTE